MNKRVIYDVHVSLPSIGISKAGELAVADENGVTQQCAFLYSADYQAADGAIPLDPRGAPASKRAILF